MLLIARVADQHTPYLASIKDLYESSFPMHERRTWDEFLKLLAEPKMFLNTIINDEQFIGFIISWRLEEWLYIEHFSILPNLRGQQFGSKVVRNLLAQLDLKVILETELPVTEDACRRVRFYEKLGFRPLKYPYNQPPYRKEETPFPMSLMTTSTIDEEEYEQVVKLIRCEVYERFY